MQVKRLRLFKKQIEFLKRPEREVLLESGIGFGKSYAGTLWLAMQVLKHPDTRWLCVARDVPQLRKATLIELKLVLDQLGQIEDEDYNWNHSTNEIKFSNKSEIHAVGANNYDSAFRGGNYSGALCDEVDYYKPEAYLTIKGRIRKHPELIRYVSSPKGFNHIYNDFYTNLALGNKYRINATTFDNPTLSSAYIDSLRATYSPRLYEQEVLGKRLRLNVGVVYNEFNRENHVKPCKEVWTSADQVYFFTDYNISNYCGVYLIYKGGVVYAIGEEHLQNEGTRAMVKRVKAKYPTAIWIGDSAGNNKRDVAADQTNYQIVAEEGIMTRHFHNPPIESRVISANSNLYHNRIVIDPCCTKLIKDLELLAWKEDGSGVDKSDITLSHASDAYTYGLWYFIPAIPKKEAKTIIHR
jgi:phage terminase large subunit